MEVLNGVVSKPIIPCNYVRNTQIPTSRNHVSRVLFRKNNKFVDNTRKLVTRVGFEDRGHLEYYHDNKNIVCGKGKGKKGWSGVSTKKRLKLVKGLVEDLTTFSGLGCGLSLDFAERDQGFVAADDKSVTISQAAEVFLAQLKQLRDEEERLKKEKEEKKCEVGDSESSSSSESSDSECDEVIDVNSMRNKAVVQPIEIAKTHCKEEPSSATLGLPAPEGTMSEEASLNSDDKYCSNVILDTTLNKDAGIDALSSETMSKNQFYVGSISSAVCPRSDSKRIEVCMGGKCKKSGSPALMEEFQRAVGNEGVVVGSKCMGKCKSAPNIKVVNVSGGENMGSDSLRSPDNPLYIGVGLEDVGLIVASYFREEIEGSGFSAAGVTL